MYISLDLETTGFDPLKDKIIEFGAIKFDENGNTETLQFLCNPGITLPKIITHITNITDKDLENTPKFEDKIDEVKNFIGNLPIIGHNIQFDINFLRAQGIEILNDQYDTHEMAGILIPNLSSYSLEVISHELNLQHEEKHRALDDSIAAMELFLNLLKKFRELAPQILKEIKDYSQKSAWPLKNLIQTLESADTSAGTTTNIPTEKTPTPNLNSNYREILDETENALFEDHNPELAADLIVKSDSNTFIAVPQELFVQLHADEETAKIDSAKNYLSIKKFQHFKEKNHFQNHEIIALIKTLIWLSQTQTGLLSEINFMGQEKTLVHKFNIDIPSENETFYNRALEKSATHKTICSHEHITEILPEDKELIIIDFEKFAETLYRRESKFIKLEYILSILHSLQELFPENENIQILIDKSTILFGLIGILFEKHHDPMAYTLRCTVDEQILDTKEWKQITDNITNLIELSHALGDLKNENNLHHLSQWKQKLTDLDIIFRQPEIEQNMIWIETDHNQDLVIHKALFSIDEKLNRILQSAKTYKLIDSDFDLGDDAAFIKKLYGLDSNLKVHKTAEANENLTIRIIENLNENDHNEIPNFLGKYFEENKERAVFLFNSKKQLEFITLKLSQKNISIISQSTGSAGKVKTLFAKEKAPCLLLITPRTWEQLEDYSDIDTLFIHKLPFDPPDNPELIINSKKFTKPFEEFQVKRAVLKLKKIIHRMDFQKAREVIILDNRVIERNYSKIFLDNLKTLGNLG